MEFYAPNGMKRPVRLSEATRRFAKDSLDRVHGLQTKATPAVLLDEIPGYEEMTRLAYIYVCVYMYKQRGFKNVA